MSTKAKKLPHEVWIWWDDGCDQWLVCDTLDDISINHSTERAGRYKLIGSATVTTKTVEE
jgi:hypothetical protein